MFYERLKQVRKQRGLTQSQVAGRTGLPQSYISKVESGGVDLRMSTFMEIARSLDFEPMLVPFSHVPLVTEMVATLDRNKAVHVRPAFTIDEEDEDDNES